MPLRNRNHVPVTPKFWRDTGRGIRIQWRSESESFDTFYARVRAFYDANSFPSPSETDVENELCQQLPKSWCDGSNRVNRVVPVAVTSGKKGCCGRPNR